MTAQAVVNEELATVRPGRGAVELVDVSKHYGDIFAVDGISLTVY